MAGENEARKGQAQEPEKGDEGRHEPEKGQGREESIEELRAERDKWKSFARRHEDLWKKSGYKPEDLKELVAASKRLKDAEDADKSELQKLSERLAAADKLVAEERGKHLRLRVAYETGLPMELVDRLRGDTEDALAEDAEKLLALLGKNADGGGMPTRPKERLRSGAAPDEEPEETDPRKLAASLPRL